MASHLREVVLTSRAQLHEIRVIRVSRLPLNHQPSFQHRVRHFDFTINNAFFCGFYLLDGFA
jgi:hypothetical protein